MADRRRGRSSRHRGRSRGRVRGHGRGRGRGQSRRARSRSSGKSGKSASSRKRPSRTGGAAIQPGFRARAVHGRGARGGRGRRPHPSKGAIQHKVSKVSVKSSRYSKDEGIDDEGDSTARLKIPSVLGEAYSSSTEKPPLTEPSRDHPKSKKGAALKSTDHIAKKKVRKGGEQKKAGPAADVQKKAPDQYGEMKMAATADLEKKTPTVHEVKGTGITSDVEKETPADVEKKRAAPTRPPKQSKPFKTFREQAVNTSFEESASEQELPQVADVKDWPDELATLEKEKKETVQPKREGEGTKDIEPSPTQHTTELRETRWQSLIVTGDETEKQLKTATEKRSSDVAMEVNDLAGKERVKSEQQDDFHQQSSNRYDGKQGQAETNSASFLCYIRLPESPSSPSTEEKAENEGTETYEKEKSSKDKQRRKESATYEKSFEESYESEETSFPEHDASKRKERRKKRLDQKRSRKKSRTRKKKLQDRSLKCHPDEDGNYEDLGTMGAPMGSSYVEEITEELFEPDIADWTHGGRAPVRLARRTRAVRRSLDAAAASSRPSARPSSSRHWKKGTESSPLEKESRNGSREFVESDHRTLGTLGDSQWASHFADEAHQTPDAMTSRHQPTRTSDNQLRLMTEEIRYEGRARTCLQNEDWPSIWQRRDDDSGGFFTGRPVVPGTVVAPGASHLHAEHKPLHQRNVDVSFQRGPTEAVSHDPFMRTAPPTRSGHLASCQLCNCPGCCGNCCLGPLRTDIRLGEPFKAREIIEAEEHLKEEERRKQKEQIRHKEESRMREELQAIRMEEEERLRKQERQRLEQQLAVEDGTRLEEKNRIEKEKRVTERAYVEEQMFQAERRRIKEQLRQQERARANEGTRLQGRLLCRNQIPLENLRGLSDSPWLYERTDRDLVLETLVEEAARQRIMRDLVEDELQAIKAGAAISVYGGNLPEIQQDAHRAWKQESRVAAIPRWSKRRCSYTGLQESETRVAKKSEFCQPPRSLPVVRKQDQGIHRGDSRTGSKKGLKKNAKKALTVSSRQHSQDDSNYIFEASQNSSAENLERTLTDTDGDSTGESEKQETQKFAWVYPQARVAAQRVISKTVSYTEDFREKSLERKTPTPNVTKAHELEQNLRKMLAKSTTSGEAIGEGDFEHAAFSEPGDDHRESIDSQPPGEVYEPQKTAGIPEKKSISSAVSTVLRRALFGESPFQTSTDASETKKTSEASTTTDAKKELESARSSPEKTSHLLRSSVSDGDVKDLSATELHSMKPLKSSIKHDDEAPRTPRSSEVTTSQQFQTAGLPSDSKTECTMLLRSEPLDLQSQFATQPVVSVPTEQSKTREYVASMSTEKCEIKEHIVPVPIVKSETEQHGTSVFIEPAKTKDQVVSVPTEQSETKDHEISLPKPVARSEETDVVEGAPKMLPEAVIPPSTAERQTPPAQEITIPANQEEDAEKLMEIVDSHTELFPESAIVAAIGFLCVAWIILLLVTSSVVHEAPSSSSASTINSYPGESSRPTGSSESIYYCETEHCIQEGSYLSSLLDEARPPCDDFYEHVCGRWIRSIKSPVDETGWSVSASTLLQEVLQNSLFNSLKYRMSNRTVAPAARLFSECMDRVSVDGFAKEHAKDLFNRWAIKKWPIPTYDVDKNHGDVWQFAGELVRDLGASFLASVSVAIDPVNDLKSVICLDSPIPLYFPSDSMQHNFTSHFRAALLQAAEDFKRHGTEPQTVSDEVFSVLERLERVSFASALSMKNVRAVAMDTLDTGVRQLLLVVFRGSPKVDQKPRVLLLNSKVIEQDLPAAVNGIDPRMLMNYLGFRALIWVAPFMPASLEGLKRLFLLESSGRMESPTPLKLCLRAVERAVPACLLKALVLPLQQSGTSLWHRHWLSQLEAAFLRSVPQAAWLDEPSKFMIKYRLKHTRVDAFFPFDLINGSCAAGYEMAPDKRAGPLYSHLLKIRQEEVLQELPGPLGYRLAQALDTEPVFRLSDQVVRVPVGLINASVPVNSTLFAFHLARVAVRLFSAMTPLLYESSVYEREIAFQFTEDSERQLEDLIHCLRADWLRLRGRPRRPNLGLTPGVSESALLDRWLLEQAGAVKQAFDAFRELLHVNRIWSVDFRYANLRQLSSSQLFFVYYALDQCEHSDVAFQRRQFLLRGQPSAGMRVTLPLRHVPAFAEAFGCSYGDNLRAEDVCHSLRH